MNNRTYYSQEAEARASRERTVLVTLFLGFGLITGAALALLFAPTKGSEIRKDLADVLEDAAYTGQKSAGHALSRLEKEFNEFRRTVEDRLR